VKLQDCSGAGGASPPFQSCPSSLLVSRIEHSALAPLPNKKRPLAEFCSYFARLAGLESTE